MLPKNANANQQFVPNSADYHVQPIFADQRSLLIREEIHLIQAKGVVVIVRRNRIYI